MRVGLCPREVPADSEFLPPGHYKQELRSYQKQCHCLVSRGRNLVTAHLSQLVVWSPPDCHTPFTLPGHSELVGQLVLLQDLLVSSGCEKTVKVWSLVSRTCLHTIDCQDGFKNVAPPKIAVDRNYLLVTKTDTIHIYDSKSSPVLQSWVLSDLQARCCV